MNKKVTIQGYEGSFHQVAARQFFGKDVDVIPCATFREVVRIGEDAKASDGAVMAMENSIAGSILPNYNLLLGSTLKVTGEVYLSISQNLLTYPGVKLEDIKEVHSHPMAILQCLDYLEKYNWKLVESEDTALSAKHLQQHRSKHVAAVASKLAAELFAKQLEVRGVIESFDISEDCSILEVEVPERYLGTPIGELNFQQKYNLKLIALKHFERRVNLIGKTTKHARVDKEINPNHILDASDILVLMGSFHDFERMVGKNNG